MDSILDKVRLTTGYALSWARVVSDIFSPPMVWAMVAIPIAQRDAAVRADGWLWAGNYILFVCVVPVLYIIWLVKSGQVTDIHLKLRSQRLRPFVVSIAGASLAVITLRLMGASDVMMLFALFTLIQLVVIAAITLTWQISVHAMSISGAAIALGALFTPLLLLAVIPLVILVGTARIKLNRHTPAQVYVGTLVGIITPVILFFILAP